IDQAYPLQGRLHVDGGVAKINIGTDVGVKAGLTFDLLMEKEDKALGNTVTATGGIGSGESEVVVQDFPLDQLPSTPETAWYVRERMAAGS
ncbi:MAG: hypothetical protein HYV26_00525, partial [Candidatus Hydrogenedentes bacterium]|nr:hypothetical protein [Candidatus Hydrogenedentota bacterium]